MRRTAIVWYKSSGHQRLLSRVQNSPEPVKVGVRVDTGGIDVTVDLIVYDNGTYELASAGLVKYVGAVS